MNQFKVDDLNLVAVTKSDDSANAGPVLQIQRTSTSPDTDDLLGQNQDSSEVVLSRVKITIITRDFFKVIDCIIHALFLVTR